MSKEEDLKSVEIEETRDAIPPLVVNRENIGESESSSSGGEATCPRDTITKSNVFVGLESISKDFMEVQREIAHSESVKRLNENPALKNIDKSVNDAVSPYVDPVVSASTNVTNEIASSLVTASKYVFDFSVGVTTTALDYVKSATESTSGFAKNANEAFKDLQPARDWNEIPGYATEVVRRASYVLSGTPVEPAIPVAVAATGVELPVDTKDAGSVRPQATPQFTVDEEEK